MLGTIEPSDFAIAIISNDINTLKKLPGVGKKTAERIVLELKDKIKKEQQIEELEISNNKSNNIQKQIKKDKKQEEVFTALQVLGYNNKQIEETLEKVDNNLSLEEMIRMGIKILSKI